ncbi:PAT complex subunit CCDC47-like [Paramacrobiotus metropolitanus]|uniref:PAT complex subunit CCDC47-like n=1 Tax=Paramacrobiotus metropolitanus TaxID=2943436 RepID=UPI002445D5E2|nr:PAT complex subunit CCDC47-like [Paramacrobiotus metropolitanus]
MKTWTILFLFVLAVTQLAKASGLDSDFAEFDEEEFVDEPSEKSKVESQKNTDEDVLESIDTEADVKRPDAGEEEDETEGDAYIEQEQYDPNEFEGYEDDRSSFGRAGSSGQSQKPPPELKIAEVPMVLGRNWEHYYVEYLLISGLMFYLVWYASGKATNSKLATAWLDTHFELLNQNFALVGDEGTNKEVTLSTSSPDAGAEGDAMGDGTKKPSKFIKEADHIYTLWCSGRMYVEGMLVTLKLRKRQDLLSSVWRLFRPSNDQICIRYYMEKEEMDTFVLAVSKKGSIPKLQKDMTELGLFCPDRKGGDRFGLPSSFTVLSEIGESIFALLDTKVLAVIEKYEPEMEYMFFSDQYNPKSEDAQQQNQQIKRPEPMKILQFCFNLPKNLSNPTEVMEYMHPLLLMTFYLVEKVHRYRLQREAKLKAEKNRQKVQEEYLKSTHAQRQEAAQLRREEKRRIEKEKILSEEDPEKQRKWEERDYRREMKKKGPKVKAIKVKAM